MISSLAEVQSRINQIQSHVASLASGNIAPGGVLSGATGSQDFQEILEAQNSAYKTSGTPSGEEVVAKSMDYLGIPYVFGGADPETGLDCSGFVQEVYDQFGIHLPRVSRDQAKFGTKVDSIAEAKPGDLVAFGSPVDHIGLYMGDGKMVVAPHTGDVVKIQEIGSRKITAIRRVLPDNATAVSAQSFNYSNNPLQRSAIDGSIKQYEGPNGSKITTNRADTLARLENSAIQTPTQFLELFAATGEKYGVDPALLAALSRTESNFRPEARSSAGAIGMMQFMPSTAKGMGVDPTDPASAIDGTARLLAGHKERFGSWDLALAAYQAGSGTVSRQGGMPDSSVTRNYVRKILNLWSDARS